jgi:hypothetical protein
LNEEESDEDLAASSPVDISDTEEDSDADEIYGSWMIIRLLTCAFLALPHLERSKSASNLLVLGPSTTNPQAQPTFKFVTAPVVLFDDIL